MQATTKGKGFFISKNAYSGLSRVVDSHLMETLGLDAPELKEIKTFYPEGYKRMFDDVLLSYARLAA